MQQHGSKRHGRKSGFYACLDPTSPCAKKYDSAVWHGRMSTVWLVFFKQDSTWSLGQTETFYSAISDETSDLVRLRILVNGKDQTAKQFLKWWREGEIKQRKIKIETSFLFSSRMHWISQWQQVVKQPMRKSQIMKRQHSTPHHYVNYDDSSVLGFVEFSEIKIKLSLEIITIKSAITQYRSSCWLQKHVP